MDVKLIKTITLAQDYNGTLSPLWTDQIVPYLTFGDYHKLCIVEIVGNTFTGSGIGNQLGFSMAVNPASQSANEKTGWMIRADFTNIRGFNVTNDFRVSSGATLKIYVINV